MIDVTKIPVYYIGLPEDDNIRLKKLLLSHGFTNVKKVDGVREKLKRIGVAKAHINALTLALAECKGPFIILEGDVDINNFVKEIRPPANADALYLGLSQWGLKNGRGQLAIAVEPVNNGFYRILNMLAAHAILYINHDYARFLLNSVPVFLSMQTNQDKMRAETMKYWKVFAPRNPMFYQLGAYKKYTLFHLPGHTNKELSSFYL